jgi:hypothetical protein
VGFVLPGVYVLQRKVGFFPLKKWFAEAKNKFL